MVFVKSLRDGLLTLSDGAGSPKTLVVSLAEGDLSIERSRDPVLLKSRGGLLDVKRGDEVPLKVSFTAKFANDSSPVLAATTLVPLITDAQTVFSVLDASGFSGSGGDAIFIDPDQFDPGEVFSWAAKAGNQLQGMTRGIEGSTARAWAAGTPVQVINLAERTVQDFLKAHRAYAGITTTRPSSDVLCVDMDFSVTDETGSVEEIATLSDFFHTGITIKEGADYNVLTVTGMAWATDVTIT